MEGGGLQKVEICLSALEEEDGYLPQVKVNEMSCFVRHVTSKVASNDAMPRGVVLFVKLLLDKRSNVLFNVVLFERLGSAVDGVLLHLLRHIGILYNSFAIHFVCSLFGNTLHQLIRAMSFEILY